MADTKAFPRIDDSLKGATVDTVYKTDPSTWEFITIPAENALGNRHDDFGLNKIVFKAGETYKVPPQIASYLRERMGEYARACVRVLQPKRDYKAEQAVSVGSARGGQFVDAASVQTL